MHEAEWQIIADECQIEARFQKTQAQVAKLKPSILARAFRGQLVPQDSADEPAVRLFERIHADRYS